MKQKAFFIIVKELSVAKNCLRPEIVLLTGRKNIIKNAYGKTLKIRWWKSSVENIKLSVNISGSALVID